MRDYKFALRPWKIAPRSRRRGAIVTLLPASLVEGPWDKETDLVKRTQQALS